MRSARSLVIVFFCFSFAWAQEEPWRTREAVTSLFWHHPVLEGLGLEIVQDAPTVRSPYPYFSDYATREESQLVFKTPRGFFDGIDDGRLVHRGGFMLRQDGRLIDLTDFVLVVHPDRYSFTLRDSEGDVWFDVVMPHPYFDPNSGSLRLENMDLLIGERLAAWLGESRLAGSVIGAMHVRVQLLQPENFALRGQCPADFSGDVDVALTALNSVSRVAQSGSEWAVVGGATLANVGVADVPWYRAIEPDAPSDQVGQHPFLVLQFYKVTDARIEQLGVSDVKHAFYAVNTDCECFGDQILYDGCADHYSAFTNADRFFLAPRDEVNAFTGDWSSLGSHFDAEPVDDYRHHGHEGHGLLDHLLVVDSTDLEDESARYYFEGWYLVQGDINIFNNMAQIQVTPHGNGFTTLDATFRQGSPMDLWVEQGHEGPESAHLAIDSGRGRLRVAVKTSYEEGQGMFRYEYAVMNHDAEQAPIRFEIPLGDGVQVGSVSFEDHDDDPLNDWVGAVKSDSVSFSGSSGNALKWGRMFNFVVLAQRQPAPGQVVLTAEQSTPDPMTATLPSPSGACIPTAQLAARYPEWPETDILDFVATATLLCNQ